MRNKNLTGGLFAAKPMPLTQTEASLSAQVADYFKRRRIWTERLNAGKVETRGGHWIKLCGEGTPDRIAIIRGQAVFIETKTKTGKVSEAQRKKHAELRDSGAIVIVADSFAMFLFEIGIVREIIEKKKERYEIYE